MGWISFSISYQWPNNVQNFEILLDYGFKVDITQSQWHYTSFYDAVNKRDNIINEKFLIEKGADVSVKSDFDIGNILHKATETANNLETLRLLINCGLDINVRNYYDRTPLKNATFYAYEDNSKHITFLLDNGADPNCRDHEDLTLLFNCIEQRNEANVEAMMYAVDYYQINEDDNIGHYCDDENQTLETAKIVFSYMDQLKVLNLLIEKNFAFWRTYESLNLFLNQHEVQCLDEFKMQKELICADRTISFAHILT